MTTKADFTEEEWARLGRAPLVAGMAISLADPGGPIEAIKESSAAMQDRARGRADRQLRRVRPGRRRETSPRRPSTARARWAASSPRAENAGEEILDELRAVNALLVEKTTPEEPSSFASG